MNRYKLLRKRTLSVRRRCMTQAEWADSLGVTVRTVRAWEQEENNPLPRTLEKMEGLAGRCLVK